MCVLRLESRGSRAPVPGRGQSSCAAVGGSGTEHVVSRFLVEIFADVGLIFMQKGVLFSVSVLY